MLASSAAGLDSMNGLDYKPCVLTTNLSLLFSEQGGDYLSDMKVRITDLSGNTFLETVSDGPKLFVRLKLGRYIVTAGLDRKTFHKTVTVRNNQQPALSFVWS
jgi:hypothetical protein